MKTFFEKGILRGALLVLLLAFSLSGCADIASHLSASADPVTYTMYDTRLYEMTDAAVINPFTGFAVSATNKKAAEPYSLVYIDITFKELQPDAPDKFDFASIEEENNIQMWKEQAKHAVLRFVCDRPSDEEHADIPDWLMELTGDGTFYDTTYGKGYSPDYNNAIFRTYHEKAIQALAEHFDDGFVCYVELGSLGHWGEWHIKPDSGIIGMPNESIREEYVRHYTDAFTNAKLLMRRPFQDVKESSLGLYNDVFGAVEDTKEWLDWIQNGGTYSQTGEKNALCAVPDFWKTAPSGGELTSSVPMQDICGNKLDETIAQLQAAHTTFIGPKVPLEEDYSAAAEKILSVIGYRLGITEVTVRQARGSEEVQVLLTWQNAGIAPLYFDLPVMLYTQDPNGKFQEAAAVDIHVPDILPGATVYTKTTVPADLIENNEALYIGILDPMTSKPSVTLVSNQNTIEGYTEIYRKAVH